MKYNKQTKEKAKKAKSKKQLARVHIIIDLLLYLFILTVPISDQLFQNVLGQIFWISKHVSADDRRDLRIRIA